jgi:rhodanese-related sulfurtransferase
MSDGLYAGDVSPEEAWDILAKEPEAVLVDCRTDAEWNFVGVPDLYSLGKQVALIPWQVFPTMAHNSKFVDQVAAQGAKADATVLFLCRSGARSRNAAMALTAAGFHLAYNVSDGFEGPHNGDRQRGKTAGWKADGLPWKQG